MKDEVGRFRVEQYRIVDRAELAAQLVVSVDTPPNNLVAVISRPKHPIQQQLEVMARGRIAVQIQRTSRLQHPVQLDQTHRHHGEIRHHVVGAQEGAHRPQQFEGIRIAAAHHLVECAFGPVVPVPRILERLDLRVAVRALGRLEQDIVIGVRIERRVEIDKVHAFVSDMFAQHVQIVAIIELVGHPHP